MAGPRVRARGGRGVAGPQGARQGPGGGRRPGWRVLGAGSGRGPGTTEPAAVRAATQLCVINQGPFEISSDPALLRDAVGISLVD